MKAYQGWHTKNECRRIANYVGEGSGCRRRVKSSDNVFATRGRIQRICNEHGLLWELNRADIIQGALPGQQLSFPLVRRENV